MFCFVLFCSAPGAASGLTLWLLEAGLLCLVRPRPRSHYCQFFAAPWCPCYRLIVPNLEKVHSLLLFIPAATQLLLIDARTGVAAKLTPQPQNIVNGRAGQ